MNSGIHYSGLIDWILFNALSIKRRDVSSYDCNYLYKLYRNVAVGFKQAVVGNSVNRTFQFAFVP